ncbi:MAG: hypothetical protein PHR45_01025 [Muribaculaceae bacterium]|nr:hypothetical protein [Muribaculaceae bacterium]
MKIRHSLNQLWVGSINLVNRLIGRNKIRQYKFHRNFMPLFYAIPIIFCSVAIAMSIPSCTLKNSKIANIFAPTDTNKYVTGYSKGAYIYQEPNTNSRKLKEFATDYTEYEWIGDKEDNHGYETTIFDEHYVFIVSEEVDDWYCIKIRDFKGYVKKNDCQLLTTGDINDALDKTCFKELNLTLRTHGKYKGTYISIDSDAFDSYINRGEINGNHLTYIYYFPNETIQDYLVIDSYCSFDGIIFEGKRYKYNELDKVPDAFIDNIVKLESDTVDLYYFPEVNIIKSFKSE